MNISQPYAPSYAPVYRPKAAEPAPAAAPPAVKSATPVMANIPQGLPAVLAEYFSKARANEAARITGFEGLAYGSTPPIPEVLDTAASDKIYIVGALKMSPEVRKIAEAGIGNMFSPEWQQAVKAAADLNGGMGDSEQGFLAYSSEHGFVRLRHPGLTPEQNRKLAAISLQTGWPIERLPCRKGEDCPPGGDPKMDEWVNEFIGKYEKELTAFIESKGQDPIEVKDGSRNRYKLEFNEEAGRVVSYQFRKAGGAMGWAQKNMSWLKPVLDVASVAAAMLGQPEICAGIRALEVGAMATANGKFSGSTLAGLASAAVPISGLSLMQQGLAAGLANAAGDVIDHGRIGPNSIAGLVTPFIPGLTGDNTLDEILVGATRTLGHAAADQRLGFADFIGMVGPALLGANPTPESIARNLQSGRLPMDQFGGLLKDFIRRFVDDPNEMQVIRNGLQVLAHAIDSKRIDPARALAALQPYFEEARRDRRAA